MTASITSGTYPRHAQPAVSQWRRFSHGLRRFLQDLGARRARHHLEQLALHHDASNPALARQLREAARHSLDS